MKKIQQIGFWRAITLLAAVFFFFACKPGDSPGDPTDPSDPTPNALVKPVVKSLIVESVTTTSAKISAWVTPNEKYTKVYVEFKTTSETSYHSQALASTLTGKDSLKVSFDVVLTTNTDYVAHIRASNQAGDNTALADVKFSTSIVTDYDGNVYHVIKIGNQYWLQENLATTHYADGVAINNITDNSQWAATDNSKKDAWCWYENKATNKKIYGALYNTYVNKKPLISGYHIPSTAEFTALIDYLGGGNVAAYKLMGNSHSWVGYTGPNNSSGFTAIPSGIRSGIPSEFKYSTGYGFLMTTTPTIFLVIGGAESLGEQMLLLNSYGKEYYGLSIRLIKD